MHFTNGLYYVFLIVVFFAYRAISERIRVRVALLVAASCLFYTVTGGRALLLLVAISVVDFTTTRLMVRFEDHRTRKRLLSVSVAIDIGALCFFKYANFLVESAASGVSLLGININAHLKLIAPIGISFFIFQSLAYVIDVYRKDAAPARSYADYLTFVSFFPTIVAGPILRARHLLPQLRDRLALDSASGGQALFLIAIGLIKKIAIADYLSANLVERVFDFPERFSSIEVLAGVYGYALQIYADFSGYSDIAIGSAMLLGFKLPENFNAPYRAASLPEFWRRWHISLSTWLRDYVFFSIAGKRMRKAAVLYCALVVTMLAGGLWHGPAWTFVAWGSIHGIGLAAARGWSSLRKRFALPPAARWSRVLAILTTFHFVCLAWIFFRAESLPNAFAVLHKLSRLNVDTSNLPLPVVLLVGLGLATHWIPNGVCDAARNGFVRLPATAQACALFVIAVGLYLIASSDVVPFIYVRF